MQDERKEEGIENFVTQTCSETEDEVKCSVFDHIVLPSCFGWFLVRMMIRRRALGQAVRPATLHIVVALPVAAFTTVCITTVPLPEFVIG